MPDYENFADDPAPEDGGVTPGAPRPQRPGRHEAEQFDLPLDAAAAPPTGPAPSPAAARAAEIERMRMRALQQRRLHADDITSERELFADDDTDGEGQGMLFASTPRAAPP